MVRSSSQPLPSSQYTRGSLASAVGVPERTIKFWIAEGLISPARGGPSRRSRYFDDGHVREIRALLAVKDNNTRLGDLGAFLREEGISIIHYARNRDLMIA